MTRIRVPGGLAVPAAVYHVEAAAADGHWYGTSKAGDRVDFAPVWDGLRESAGVGIECAKHPGAWWRTSGQHLALAGVRDWRCPTCAWAFREGLKGRGGTPQF